MRPSATSSITGPVFLLLACLAMILGAYGFQYIGGLAPCELCYWQRYAYYAAIPLAALATAVAATSGPRAARIPLLLTGLALLAGMGIAGYHAGVEYHWWPGPDTCSVPDLSGPGNILDAVMQQSLVRCDETPWSLLGISMAGYNFLISGLLALVAFRLALKGR